MKLSQQGCTKKTKAEELSNHLIGCHSLLVPAAIFDALFNNGFVVFVILGFCVDPPTLDGSQVDSVDTRLSLVKDEKSCVPFESRHLKPCLGLHELLLVTHQGGKHSGRIKTPAAGLGTL